MANLSFRMLSVFLFAAFLLNISNYLFIRVYSSPRHSNYNDNYRFPKTASGMEARRSPSNTEYWSSGVKWVGKNKVSSVSRERNNESETYATTYSAYYVILDKAKVTANDAENCPELPPGLGPELEDRSLIAKNLNAFEAKYNEVQPGGIYHPTTCQSLQSVAVIIAYRGCKSYLSTFMNILHPFLIKQQLDYQIFVVEQSNKTQPYNRGKLLNVGFTEASRYRKDGFRCIILHEPHIVPMDSRNLYRCSWYPRQLATTVERPVRASYTPLFGGAIAMTPEQFLKVNGFSNAYWGNDADYLDLYHRINSTDYYVENAFPLVGKYKTIRKGLGLWHKSEYLSTPAPLYLLDGLTSLSYNVDNFELRRLYTYLQVNIGAVAETKSRPKKFDKSLNPVTTKATQHVQK